MLALLFVANVDYFAYGEKRCGQPFTFSDIIIIIIILMYVSSINLDGYILKKKLKLI